MHVHMCVCTCCLYVLCTYTLFANIIINYVVDMLSVHVCTCMWTCCVYMFVQVSCVCRVSMCSVVLPLVLQLAVGL